MATVSVIIPTYYRYPYLVNVLEGLGRQTLPPHEVLVADQTPMGERPAGFYDRFAEMLPLKVIDFEQPSLTAPRNGAARVSTGETLLFLDDDVVLPDGLIEAHVRVMERERVDVVNGAVSRTPSLPEEYPWDISAMDPVRFFLAAPNHSWSGMMLGVSSCNFSIGRNTFFAVEGFDEDCPRMVDFELGYRLFRHGAKIYFSDEPFAQHLGASAGGSRKNPRAHDRLVAALYIHKKHFPGWITRQFVLKHLLFAYFRRRSLVKPWMALAETYRLIQANRVVNQKLKSLQRPL